MTSHKIKWQLIPNVIKFQLKIPFTTVLFKSDSSPVFALQLDESTDISNLSQLLVYVRYVADERINEKFLFCQPLETTSKAVDVFEMLIDFFDKTELSCIRVISIRVIVLELFTSIKVGVSLLGYALMVLQS